MKKQRYERLSLIQNGSCAICGKKETESKKLVVDHNHKTGKVRGLLCHSCNTALGLVKEDIEILKKMIKYIEEN